MKAISLWQPWASLVAWKDKPFETRAFAPPLSLIGQTIAIHAAKKIDKDAAQLFIREIRAGGGVMPVGCVVCTAKLDAAFLLGDAAPGTAVPAASVVKRMLSRPMPECFTVRLDAFGDYSQGRWAWLLSDIKPLVPPVAALGRQGWFDFNMGEAT